MINTKDGITAIDGTLDELMMDIITVISTTAVTVGTEPGFILEAVQGWYDHTKKEGPDKWKEGIEDVKEESIQEERSRETVVSGIQERIRRRRGHHCIS